MKTVLVGTAMLIVAVWAIVAGNREDAQTKRDWSNPQYAASYSTGYDSCYGLMKINPSLWTNNRGKRQGCEDANLDIATCTLPQGYNGYGSYVCEDVYGTRFLKVSQ